MLEATGTDRFGAVLLNHLQEAFGADYCAVFRLGPHAPSELVTGSHDGSATAHTRVSAYLQRQTWAKDPAMVHAQTRLAAVQAREKILLQLSGGRYSWHGAMSHLGVFMPRRVWLSEIGSAQKGVVLLKGNALNYQELVTFLSKLEQDRFFVDPTLLKAEQNERGSLTQFEITAKIRGL